MASVESHSHPLGDGRSFQHVHAIPVRAHRVMSLREAHPDLEVGPPPGSPADLRRQAVEWRDQGRSLRADADRADQRAAELEAQAAQDEQRPPTEAERVRRLLDRGLS